MDSKSKESKKAKNNEGTLPKGAIQFKTSKGAKGEPHRTVPKDISFQYFINVSIYLINSHVLDELTNIRESIHPNMELILSPLSCNT